MKKTKVHLHSEGRTLWPEIISEEEALLIESLTPPNIFQAIYQADAKQLSHAIFREEYFKNQRVDLADGMQMTQIYAFSQSWDTALTGNEKNAASAGICVGIRPDYSIVVLDFVKGWWEFPDLIDEIVKFASKWHYGDGRFREIILEKKVSGQSAAQVLKSTGPTFFQDKIVEATPLTDKIGRAGEAAVWCKNEMIYLPTEAPWLEEFERDLYSFPDGKNKDTVDAFSQVVYWYSNYLVEGFIARNGGYYDFGNNYKKTAKEYLLDRIHEKPKMRFV